MAHSSTFQDSAFALIAGIAEFEDPEVAPRSLPQAANDSLDLRKVLCERLGWKSDHVVQVGGKVCLSDIQKALDQLEALAREAKPSLFLLYISTHGHLYENAKNQIDTCLVTSDSNLSTPRRIYDTALTPIRLGTYLASIDAACRVVIADACHSATTAQPQNFFSERLGERSGAIVMASSYGLSYAEPGARNSRSTEKLLHLLDRSRGSVDLLGVYRQLADKYWLMHGQNILPRVLIGIAGHSADAVPLTVSQVLLYTRWKLQEALDSASGRPLREQRYVTRAELEESFTEFLYGFESKIYTISGGAGSGKTTSTLRLAQIAAENGFPTLWITGAELTAAEGVRALMERRFQILRADLPLENIVAPLGGGVELCVIVDAINEWEASAEAFRSGLTELMALSREKVRVVISCRDTHWELVRTELQQEKPSVRLTAFDDNEAAIARRLFGFLKTINQPELARQPLFLRIAAETFEQTDQALDSNVTVASILASYVALKFARAAELINESPETIAAKTRDVIRAMLDEKVESLPVRKFLELAKESIGLALLECGLFRRIASTVSVEAQTLHEFLVAQDPGVDPFNWIYESGRKAEEYQPLLGAALFRLAEMENSDAVLGILHQLAAQESLAPIFALPRLSNLPNYQDFFFNFLSNAYRAGLAIERLLFVLERSAPGDFEFCMAMAKRMYLNENYYFWERKHWRHLSKAAFSARLNTRRRLRSRDFLLPLFAAHQEATLSTLYSDWLKDHSLLMNGSNAAISGVALTFICAFSKEVPELGVALLDKYVEEVDFNQATEITQELTDSAPAAMLVLARKWIQARGRRLEMAAMILSRGGWPFEEVSDIIDPVIRNPRLNKEERIALASTIGKFQTKGSFESLAGLASDPRLAAVVVQVLKTFPPADPQDALRIVRRARESGRPDEAMDHAIAEFYARYQSLAPAEAVAYLEPYIGRWPKRESGLVSDLKKQDGNPELERFIDARVRAVADPALYEDYLDCIRSYRRLNRSDVEWLLQWADSGSDVFELILHLADSEIPFDDSYKILQRLEKEKTDYWQYVVQMLETPEQETMLRQFAERVLSRPETAGFAELNRVWLSAIAAGAGSTAADEAAVDYMLGED